MIIYNFYIAGKISDDDTYKTEIENSSSKNLYSFASLHWCSLQIIIIDWQWNKDVAIILGSNRVVFEITRMGNTWQGPRRISMILLKVAQVNLATTVDAR